MRQTGKNALIGLLLCFWVLHLNAQVPSWGWVNGANSNGDERVTDIATDPLSLGVFAVGYWEDPLNVALPGLTTSYGNRDGFVAKYLPDGTVDWAFSIGSAGIDECFAVAADDSGNVYVTGFFTGTAQFRGAGTSPSGNLTSAGGEDVFVAKYGNNGHLRWTSRGSSLAEAIGRAIEVDANGVYVTGGTRGAITFGANSLPHLNGMDAFTVKLDKQTGLSQWARQGVGNGNNERGLGIVSDGTDLYTVGMFASGTVTFDGSTSLTNPTAGFREIYVTRRNANTGNIQWARRIGGADGEEAHGIALDNTGIFITGGVDDDNAAVDFPNWPPVTTGNSGEDIFVCRLLKSNGNTNWVNIEPNNANDDCRGDAVAYDGNGTIYVTGLMHGNTNFGPGTGATTLTAAGDDIFVSAYDATNGNLLWAKGSGSSNIDGGWGIDTTCASGIYVGGAYRNTATFEPTLQLPNDGGDNIWVGKIGGGILTAQTDSVCVPNPVTVVLDVQANDNNPLSQPLTTTVLIGPTQGTETVLNGDSIQYAPNAATSGLDSLYYQICNPGGCCSGAWAYFKVHPLANAGADAFLCTPIVQLNGNDPSPATGEWTVTAGSGTVVSPTQFNSNFNVAGTGVNTLEWEISYLGCTSVDQVDLTIDNVPPSITCPANQVRNTNPGNCSAVLAGIAPDTSFDNCPGYIVNYVLTGATNTSGTADASVEMFALGTTQVTYTVSDPLGNTTNCSFTVTINDNTAPVILCPSDTTFLPPVSCAYNVPDVTSWITALSDNCTNAASIAVTQSPAPGTPLNGSTSITLTADDGNGNTSTCTFNVQLDLALTSVDAGRDTSLCNPLYTLMGSDPAPGTGTWMVVSGGGTVSNVNDRFATLSGLLSGTSTFEWTVVNGNCAGSDTVKIAYLPPDFADAGIDTTICGPVFQLEGVLPPGSTGLWTLLLGNGTFADNTLPTTTVSGLTPGANEFQWSVTAGSCTDTARVTITSDEVVTANAGRGDTSLCGSELLLQAVAPPVGTGNWEVISGNGTLQSPGQASTLVSGLSTGLNEVVWQVQNGVCEDRDTLTITVSSAAADAGADFESCQGDTLILGGGPWGRQEPGQSIQEGAR